MRSPEGGDGISYVARLLERACRDLFAIEPRTVTVAPGRSGSVGRAARTRFVAGFLAAQARGAAAGWMFNHIGIARAQNVVPPFLRRPYGVFLHGVEAWDPGLSAGRKSVVKGAALRLSNSHYTAARIERAHPDLGPVRPCPLAILPDDAPPRGVPDTEILSWIRPLSVAIIGRMAASERYKGHDQLLEAWPAVVDRVPTAQLVIVGRGDDADRLRRKATELGISADVLFTGFVSDATVRHLLRRLAAFAMPSSGEGFGLVYLEAMRAGLPCIGSTADAAGDVIRDGETGLLVDPEDRCGLAAAVVRLLEHPQHRRALGAAGLSRFEREFTFERFRDRLGVLLRDTFQLEPRVDRD